MRIEPLSTQTALPKPVRVFWLINGLLAVLCPIVIVINRYIFHLGEGVHWQPYTSPFLPWGHFCDFWNFHDRFMVYHTTVFYSTTAGSIFSYPAPLSLLYALFFLPQHNQHSIFTVTTTLPLLGMLYVLGREMIAAGISRHVATMFVVSAFLFSYPYWFEWELGNIEICVFLIVAFGVFAWLRGRLYLAAALFGIAGSMKIFPFLYLGLLLSRKRYRQFGFGLLVAALLYPLSVWMACPSFSIAFEGIRASSRALGTGLLPYWDWVLANVDHSLWSFYKQAMHLMGYKNERPMWEVTAYTALMAAGGTALYFLRIRRLPMLNQLICLCIASILLPPMSNDYTLLYLYLPWGLLVISTIREQQQGVLRPGVFGAFICFGILFSAESEIVIARAAVAGQLKAATLVVLLYLALKYPFVLPSEHDVTQVRKAAGMELAAVER